MTLLNILLQVQHSSEMADAEDTSKFFVVIGVIAVLFAGIVVYLLYLDNKLKRLEKEAGPNTDVKKTMAPKDHLVQ